jgi:Stress responsive A/B Barrel Domain
MALEEQAAVEGQLGGTDKEQAMIRHVVLFQWKPGTSEAKIDELFRALAGLKGKIPGLQQFEGGPYSSPEGLNKQWSHAFIMTFPEAASRDAYLPHPEHERVKAMIEPHLADVIAFDFEV